MAGVDCAHLRANMDKQNEIVAQLEPKELYLTIWGEKDGRSFRVDITLRLENGRSVIYSSRFHRRTQIDGCTRRPTE